MRPLVATLIAALALAAPAGAQVPDHLKCYKVKDALKLGGTVDLNSPQFGVESGCKVSSAKLFCVTAAKTNVAVTNKTTKQPITPLPVSGPDPGDLPGDRICYKVKCPTPTTPIADQSVTDQFGNRMVSKFSASLVCTPAFKGSARFVDNGNSITDNYTGLQWMKTCCLDSVADFGNPQDADNTYTWGDLGGCTFTGCPNGSAFTDFLGRLNSCTSADGSTPVFAGFAARCDWRLPTFAELRTIRDCSFGSPCIDPIFGPTAASAYWSSTTGDVLPYGAWDVGFGGASAGFNNKRNPGFVRAVRGGSAD